mmetsp:Transcript_40965/g.73665  ORF Transcript_40965/g.73665 Transcript_40965/m.73665 type:complete len:341 (+) Transcript_40965:42-1064(+)
MAVRKRAKAKKSSEASTSAATPDLKAVRKRGKAKKSSEASTGAATPEELRRRDEQRKLQQLVMDLKKQGLPDDEIKRRKNKLKTDLRWSADDRREFWKQKKRENMETKKQLGSVKETHNAENSGKTENGEEGDDEEDARLEKDAAIANHEVIVIPIIWRSRHDRHQLLNAAEDVKAVLAQQKIDCWIDSRRQHTPGQKFAYWEHKGAKFRIEIGPKDFEQGRICVCKHPETPGDYKNTIKQYVDLPPHGARDLLIQLKKFGLDKLNIVLPANEDKDLTVMEKINYSLEGVDGAKDASDRIAKSSGDALEENYVLAAEKSTKSKKAKLDHKASKKKKVKKS